MRQSALALVGLCLFGAALSAQQPTLVPLDRPLTLVDAVRLGRERAVVAVLARLGADVAGDRSAQRRADLLPQVTGTARFDNKTLNLNELGLQAAVGVTDPFDVWGFRLRATQVLFDASLFQRARAASDSAVAAGLDARAAGDLAGTTAGLAWLRAVGADEAVRARLADSVIAATVLDEARHLVTSGVNPAIDSTRSAVNLAAVQTQLTVARNQAARGRLDLARILDLPPATPIRLGDSLSDAADGLPVDVDSAVAFALSNRDEVKAEEARLQASQRALGSVKDEYLPSLTAAGEIGTSGRSLNGLDGTYLVGVGLSVPIFDGLRRPNRVKEQQARLAAQEYRLHDARQQVDIEARQAWLDLAAARHQVNLATTRLALAEEVLRQASERFEAGVASTIETTNAQLEVAAARDVLIQARVALGVARLGSYRALGLLSELDQGHAVTPSAGPPP